MFSALNPGDSIHILYRNLNDKPVLKIGKVVSKTEPVPTYNSFGANYNDTKFTLLAEADNEQMKFENVSSNASVMNDPSSGTFISETAEAMIQEINNLQRTSKKHVDDTPYHENALAEYDKMLKALSPQYADNKRRDEDIAKLNKRQDDMDAKLDKILKAVTGSN